MAPTVKKPKEKGVFGRLLNKLLGYSFATRMTVLFALIATMTVFVAVGVLSYVWEQHFQAYTRENVEQLAEVIPTRLEITKGKHGSVCKLRG